MAVAKTRECRSLQLVEGQRAAVSLFSASASSQSLSLKAGLSFTFTEMSLSFDRELSLGFGELCPIMSAGGSPKAWHGVRGVRLQTKRSFGGGREERWFVEENALAEVTRGFEVLGKVDGAYSSVVSEAKGYPKGEQSRTRYDDDRERELFGGRKKRKEALKWEVTGWSEKEEKDSDQARPDQTDKTTDKTMRGAGGVTETGSEGNHRPQFKPSNCSLLG